MLVLSRQIGETIVIGGGVRVTVVDARMGGNGKLRVRLGIDAPRDVPIHREEVWASVQKEIADGNADSVAD